MNKTLTIVKYLLVIGLFHQSLSLFARDDKAEALIKKVKTKYDNLKIFYAEFQQTSHWKLADNVQEQQGKIWLKDKDKFRIETPDQTVVSDGKTIWTYSQFSNQVIIDHVADAGEEMRLPRDIFLKYSEDYRPAYLKDEIVDGQNCAVLELQAKAEDIFIKYMKIWINEKLLVPIKIEQIDINDNSTTYLLMNIDTKVRSDDSFFNYQIPTSAEVIDMR